MFESFTIVALYDWKQLDEHYRQMKANKRISASDLMEYYRLRGQITSIMNSGDSQFSEDEVLEILDKANAIIFMR